MHPGWSYSFAILLAQATREGRSARGTSSVGPVQGCRECGDDKRTSLALLARPLIVPPPPEEARYVKLPLIEIFNGIYVYKYCIEKTKTSY